MTKFCRRFLAAGLKTHVFQYPGSPVEDQAIELILAAPHNLLLHDRRTGRLHKSIHQTSKQECRALCCLAFGHTPSPVTRRQLRTLQESVHNMGDTDKEPVSNLCGHCGAFLLAQTHSPLPSQKRTLTRFLDRLQNKTTWPLRGSSPSRSRTIPCKPSKPLRRSVDPTAK
jgi:hypothetical protein